MKPARSPRDDKESPFYVPPLLDFLGSWVHRFPHWFVQLGNLESALLADELRRVHVDAPIYVCGLARSGSTLLHEIVASCKGVATHRIKDYPMTFTPCWWRRATARLRPREPHERPHRDRVMITSESPDAMEEMLWMAFFPWCHDPSINNVLDGGDRHKVFEAFYRLHICKLLLAERASRYAAKNNYHVGRLAYLVRVFPDAKFILPVRGPVGHIASLMRQHAWFSQGQRQNARALAFMRRSGHFEFGLDRRPMNLGDARGVQRILDAWARGDEVGGWACCWSMTYGFLAQQLKSDPHVRAAAHIVRFEDLCAAPDASIRAMLEHCRLADAGEICGKLAGRIAPPNYYQHSFTDQQLAVIDQETAAVAKAWGY